MSFAAKLLPVEAPASTEERYARRFRVRLDALGEATGVGQAGITVHDLSTEGFLLETDARLLVGAEIALELPGAGAVQGELVWSSGRFFGGRFATPLSPQTLQGATAQSRVVWPDFGGQAPGPQRSRTSALLIAEGSEVAAEKLPYASRLRLIFGLSALFWTAAAGIIWTIA